MAMTIRVSGQRQRFTPRRRHPLLRCLLVCAAGIGLGIAQARAQGDESICGDLFSEEQPVLYRVKAGASRLHFHLGGETKAGCPSESDTCRDRSYVVGGDPVIGTRKYGGFVCATFASPTGKSAVTIGWLPTASLDMPSAGPASQRDWLGEWRSGQWHRITIKKAAKGAISLDGSALYGADDPGRRERGAVNTGEIAATLTPEGGSAAFSLDFEGEVHPHDAQGDGIYCRVRMWQLGPYLAVEDNVQCGGHNVTFTGIYRRAATKR
jgi:hypothetical protein